MSELEEFGVIVPVHRDGGAANDLVRALLAAAEYCSVPISIVVADNGGNDGFEGRLPNDARLRVVQVNQRGPGHARTGAARALMEDWRQQGKSLDRSWIISIDADSIIEPEFLTEWAKTITNRRADVLIGPSFFSSLAGDSALPEDMDAANVWLWSYTGLCEAFVGTVNADGCNHAVRASTCEINEYYVQPVISVEGREVNVAGSDWDFGLRARLRGFGVDRVATPTCTTSARRLIQDPAGFLTGRSYEMPFEPVAAGDVLTAWPPDEDWAAVVDYGRARIVAHFLLKPMLAGLSVNPSLRWFLSDALCRQLNALARMAPPELGQWQTYRSELISRLFEPEMFEFSRRIGRRLGGLRT